MLRVECLEQLGSYKKRVGRVAVVWLSAFCKEVGGCAEAFHYKLHHFSKHSTLHPQLFNLLADGVVALKGEEPEEFGINAVGDVAEVLGAVAKLDVVAVDDKQFALVAGYPILV